MAVIPQQIILLLLPLLISQQSNGEVFTSMADMEGLLNADKHVDTVIDKYIQLQRTRLEQLREYAKTYAKRNKDYLAAGPDVVFNPVNAYLLIKRLTTDWGQVESMMKDNMADEFLQNITSKRDFASVRFPEREDLSGAATALLRLQDTYRLRTEDIADGNIQGVKSAMELTANDCFELGRVAYNGQNYYSTILWMKEAQHRAAKEDPPTIEEVEILEYLAYSLYQQGNLRRALDMTRKLLQISPDHPRAQGNVDWYLDEMKKDGISQSGSVPPEVNMRPSDGGVPEQQTYEALCRGEVPVSETIKSSYYCYLKRDKPFLWLAPIKAEIVHLDPLAVKFIGVVSDAEIDRIKELAYPRLQRATVQNSVTGDLETASYRVSKSAWLKHEEDDVIARVNRRIGDMTNLNMDTAEDLQIANYGLGGHYDPHYDFARLEAPEAGGATVFTQLNLALFPTKYDCVFWYNLMKDGEGDMRTRHAACPVLSGQKWVANKWIHERGQENFRPCGLAATEFESRVGDEKLYQYPFRNNKL